MLHVQLFLGNGLNDMDSLYSVKVDSNVVPCIFYDVNNFFIFRRFENFLFVTLTF